MKTLNLMLVFLAAPILFATSNPSPLFYASTNTIELFVVRTDGNVWHNFQPPANNQVWSGWTSLGSAGGGFSLAPLAIVDPNKRTDVFALGANGNVYEAIGQPDSTNGWSSWTALGNPTGKPLRAAPVVIVNAANELDVLVNAPDGNIWHNTWTSAAGTTWTGWSSLGNGGAEFPNPPAAAIAPGAVEMVFAIGADGNLYQNAYQNTKWTGWSSLGTGNRPLLQSPAVIPNPNGALEVFALETQSEMWRIWQTPGVGNGWSAWASLGGWGAGFAQTPTAILDEGGKGMEVLEVGSDGTLYHTYSNLPYNESSWAYWWSLGNPGIAFSAPATPVIDGALASLVFETAADGNVYIVGQGGIGNSDQPWGWSAWFPTMMFAPTAASVKENIYFGSTVVATENH